MTIYVSNILSTVEDIDDFDGNYKIVTERLKKLITAILESDATVVIVTNEVGSGIVPNNRLAREYRDLAGLANQMLAEVAEKVFLVVSGIPVDIKKIAESI
jgi:adenosylcobinamide kinase/adenosylcobinamide-phosphate guanylyltransferase